MRLRIKNSILTAGPLAFAFPAVRFAAEGKIYQPEGYGSAPDALTRIYQSCGVTFIVRLEPLAEGVWCKHLILESSRPLPTPDFVELDRQLLPDSSMTQRGYRATIQCTDNPKAEEEGGGLMPGCGYPLIGKNFFVGVEHPAAFAAMETDANGQKSYVLTQHPVWDENNRIELAPVVCGWSDDAEKSFRDYLDTIRIPALSRPVFSLCSFWSDPYLGNYEYQIEEKNYRRFVDAFHALGIQPDLYTLDAGWQDRHTIFEPKAAFGGERGLASLKKHVRRCGSQLGLWVSYNGPAGIAPDFLEQNGFAVGSGESASYSGKGFGVLLDKNLEEAVGNRLAELARQGIMQFKIDWDNDCAVNPDFTVRYPTRNHVREGSVNAIIRILKKIRQANPALILRNGWWPSPWWLRHLHHVFLSDSNDSEYTSFPSRTQRDSAATYRDTMYYAVFQRDHSAFPLDAVDNHEFPHALRNPFHETPGTTANILMLAIMRGTSYFPLTLQPEALEEWFAGLLRQTMTFARSLGSQLYHARSAMIGGNPNAGEVYGFNFETSHGIRWLLLRNPASVPRECILPEDDRHGIMVYPFFSRIELRDVLLLAPHEVRLIRFSPRKQHLPYEVPFQAFPEISGKTAIQFPAHLAVTKKTAPRTGAIYHIEGIQVEWKLCENTADGLKLLFKLRLPYRMRNATLDLEISNTVSETVRLEARQSRAASDWYSACQLPVTRLEVGMPGSGERKNPDLIPEKNPLIFVIPCAEGGESWYSLFLHGVQDRQKLRLSISGAYAPTRRKMCQVWDPAWLPQFPIQHPDGFPVAKQIVLPQ